MIARRGMAPPYYRRKCKQLSTTSLDLEDGSAIIVVPNVFVRQEIESRYLIMLASALREVLGYGVEIQVVIGNDAPG